MPNESATRYSPKRVPSSADGREGRDGTRRARVGEYGGVLEGGYAGVGDEQEATAEEVRQVGVAAISRRRSHQVAVDEIARETEGH